METQTGVAEMSKHHTVAAQRIKFDNAKIMKAGETYKANNGATVILNEFYIDYEGSLYVSYAAMHPQMDGGKWAKGSKAPNDMYHWLWS